MQDLELETLRGSACSIHSMFLTLQVGLGVFFSSVVWFGISCWRSTELHRTALVTGSGFPGVTVRSNQIRQNAVW